MALSLDNLKQIPAAVFSKFISIKIGLRWICVALSEQIRSHEMALIQAYIVPFLLPSSPVFTCLKLFFFFFGISNEKYVKNAKRVSPKWHYFLGWEVRHNWPVTFFLGLYLSWNTWEFIQSLYLTWHCTLNQSAHILKMYMFINLWL